MVMPDSGPSARFPAEINMNGNATATVDVSVVIPAGLTSRIYAWTR